MLHEQVDPRLMCDIIRSALMQRYFAEDKRPKIRFNKHNAFQRRSVGQDEKFFDPFHGAPEVSSETFKKYKRGKSINIAEVKSQSSYFIFEASFRFIIMEEVSAIKIPTFIPSDPSLWFTMLELTFELVIPKPIMTSRTKSNHCVISLPSDIAMTLGDIIISPDKTDPYA
ncbi:uncharacterized protein NPIL_402851 [Nephila pilipes]|uniref:DUF7041 domain-containing protein n=1 Tax=Nephila pilipes TaxID=299642 RepID=A0A8X6Q9T3_NEPPI|nr:uncharacterized protein NPIL_498711 [Nephila pilipes]GFU09948.1 uncharacterized protein NPIL_402851 [Nephila pilipes]